MTTADLSDLAALRDLDLVPRWGRIVRPARDVDPADPFADDWTDMSETPWPVTT